MFVIYILQGILYNSNSLKGLATGPRPVLSLLQIEIEIFFASGFVFPQIAVKFWATFPHKKCQKVNQTHFSLHLIKMKLFLLTSLVNYNLLGLQYNLNSSKTLSMDLKAY